MIIKIWCWLNKVCPKHFVKKQAVLSPGSIGWTCASCEQEKVQDFDKILETLRSRAANKT